MSATKFGGHKKGGKKDNRKKYAIYIGVKIK